MIVMMISVKFETNLEKWSWRGNEIFDMRLIIKPKGRNFRLVIFYGLSYTFIISRIEYWESTNFLISRLGLLSILQCCSLSKLYTWILLIPCVARIMRFKVPRKQITFSTYISVSERTRDWVERMITRVSISSYVNEASWNSSWCTLTRSVQDL